MYINIHYFFYNKMESNLINKLQSYDAYKNMSEYQIRKTIGQQYDIKRARNIELSIELDKLKQPKIQILPEDIAYELLLKTSYKDLSKLCLTNKMFNHLCQQNSFWIKKYNYDQLPVFKELTHAKEEYKKVYDIINQVNCIFNLRTDSHHTLSIKMIIDGSQNVTNLFLNYNLKVSKDFNFKKMSSVELYYKDKLELAFKSNEYVTYNLDIRKTKEIWMALIYYHPRYDIEIQVRS